MTTGRRTRVLHIVNNLNYGGMERLVAEIARRTDGEHFDTHVLVLWYVGHFGEGLEKFATVHVATPMTKWSMLYPRNLAAQISEIAPDVVHIHSGVLYKASLASALAGVPYQIYTDHGRQHPEPWLNKMIDRRASGRVDVVAAVSDALAERLSEIVRDASKIRVVYNGVDTERYTPRQPDATIRRELSIESSSPIIGSVGRLELVKGYDVLVAAFARLLRGWTDEPTPVLVLVGEGSERAVLQKLAADLGVQDSVRFVGWRSDIERLLGEFTVFAMSSHSEGTSVSLLEAMSSGVCPVVTNVGGNSFVLGSALSHRLVPPREPALLSEALVDALRDKPRRETDAVCARSRVEATFGLDAMVRQYESIYRQARAQATTPAPS